ncbi:hypothetical protein F5B22DRAFT_650886 [Xylaria bambusicola]|uniref:uncharacterized protein n=1 Tax=Xylaria bambusicola TaxID=326684 RepID=UPI002007923D|nr:uncharacterized protein F5B22DRAFT_650886 [Xylaria bambusicola]KAI0506326.1 hypothetical protein F5B22DRAFT_650886 [Xylaria bambusicola]
MDWVAFGDRTAWVGQGCQFAGTDVNECIGDHSIFWHGYPVVGNVSVPNPKDIVTASYVMARELAADAADAQRFAPYDLGSTSRSDLVDALSLPALLLAEAVVSMMQVVETADKILKEQRKSDIVNFITSIFLLVSFVGEAIVVDSYILRIIVAATDDLANLALAIYEIVDGPSSALSTIFGFFLGGGFTRQPWKDAAATRRGMPTKGEGWTPA